MESVRDIIAFRFLSVLKDLSTVVLPSAMDKPLPPGVTEDGKPIIMRVFKIGCQLLESCDGGVALCQPFSEEVSLCVWVW